MMNSSPLIEKLKKQEAEIKKKIRAAQQVEAKKVEAIYRDKCRIIGAAVLCEFESNDALVKSLQPIIDKHTSNAKDRKVLGLADLQKKEK